MQDAQALTASLVFDKHSESLAKKDLCSLENHGFVKLLSLSGSQHCSLVIYDQEQVWLRFLKSLSIFHTLRTNKAAKR